MLAENKTIQSLWIGSRLSRMERLSIRSFLCNGHDFDLYVYKKIRGIPEGVRVKNANEILPAEMIFKYKKGPGKGSYGAFSNLFRFKLLFKKGGFWCDLDAVCLRPFDFQSPYVFSSELFYPETGETISGSAVIKAPRQSEIMRLCFERASKMDPNTVQWGETGPRLMHAMIKELNLAAYVLPPSAFCPIGPASWHEIINPNFQFKIKDENYAIHLWQEHWRRQRCCHSLKSWIRAYVLNRRRIDKNFWYSPQTLYGCLQEKYLKTQKANNKVL